MKDRLITLLGGALSLFVMLGLLLPPSDPASERLSLPTTEDRGSHGLLGLKQWLDANAIPNMSWRRRYAALWVDTGIPDSGNLMVISEPQRVPVGRAELTALVNWVRQGNYVLLLSAQQDNPPWSLATQEYDQAVLLALGYYFDEVTDEAETDASDDDTAGSETQVEQAHSQRRDVAALADSLWNQERQPLQLEPRLAHPLLQDIERVSTFQSSLGGTADLRLHGRGAPRQSLVLLQQLDRPLPALWAFRSGAGGGWVSAHPDLFGNITLGLADNARLFAQLARQALTADGYILFDDYHFGLSDLYDPGNFFRDPRLHTSLWFIGLFWLIYLLGYNNRLAPPAERPTPPHAAEFVEAMAGLLSRRITRVATARGLLEHFQNSLRAHYKMPTQDDIAALLKRSSKVTAQDQLALVQMQTALAQNRRVDLLKLTRLIDRIKEALQ